MTATEAKFGSREAILPVRVVYSESIPLSAHSYTSRHDFLLVKPIGAVRNAMSVQVAGTDDASEATGKWRSCSGQ
jgi:hypothetical protein